MDVGRYHLHPNLSAPFWPRQRISLSKQFSRFDFAFWLTQYGLYMCTVFRSKTLSGQCVLCCFRVNWWYPIRLRISSSTSMNTSVFQTVRSSCLNIRQMFFFLNDGTSLWLYMCYVAVCKMSFIFAGVLIEEMLGWKGDYVKLERNHNYIQWWDSRAFEQINLISQHL